MKYFLIFIFGGFVGMMAFNYAQTKDTIKPKYIHLVEDIKGVKAGEVLSLSQDHDTINIDCWTTKSQSDSLILAKD